MKEKIFFIKALSTLMWSWGSDPPAEAVWAGNDLLAWYESEYGIKLNARFDEDPSKIGETYGIVIDAINKS